MTSPATSACKVVNADGQILASRSNGMWLMGRAPRRAIARRLTSHRRPPAFCIADDGEGIAVADIEIAKMRPARPTAAQPPYE